MEINGFEINEYNIYSIAEKAKTSICPKCSQDRKKKTDKCMSVHWDTGLGQCNHCGETIQLHTYKSKQVIKEYIKPILNTPKLDLSDKLLKYMLDIRSISKSALNTLKIREAKEWMPQTKKEENVICFDYYLENELINVKYRDAYKHFKLFKGAEKIFYNIDNIATSKECIIVEGEFDVLSFVTAGYINCVSVPNGFNLKGDISLDYLDNYYNYFENKEVIYLAVDNDAAGIHGQKELIRRFGAEKCKIVDFKDCKDANDYLIKYGKDELSNTIVKAKDVKIEGIFSVADARKDMIHSYKYGQDRGTTTYISEMDNAWTWRGGEVNLWTGYQNEGKSLLLNQLCTIRAYWENAKVAVFSPENFPIKDFFNDIIEMYIGKSCDPYYTNNYMCEDDFNEGMSFVENNFFLVHPENDFKLESIFERVRYLVRKKGIRTLIIDPYNTIEHMMKNGEREDLYISRFMAILKRFAVENDISINLVAHQLTARKNENDEGRYHKPMLNNIKGGGTFADKADNVLFVWRPNRALDFKDSEVIFGSQKIKKQKLVGIPQDIDNINFDIRMNRYLFNGITPFTKIDYHRKGINIDEIKEIELPKLSVNEAFETSEEIDHWLNSND
ncbi:toprim domain-containing protein [uncultured Lutibacter sp.]|uniref:toprim domain-containing protein n=1 Tax=uncultured Lutibacter sp. TaxID=437739 RepID=UPI0026123CE7|nr:toprim domain-containing protein [uncultured Lutibacter sp.]